MQSFNLQKCQIHPEVVSQLISFDQTAKRRCHRCKQSCKNCMTNSEFTSKIADSSTQMQEAEAKSFRRHQELSEIARQFKNNYALEDDQIFKNMLKRLEVENRTYKQACSKIQALKDRLGGVSGFIKYFQKLNDGGMYEMKINLSSEKGLKKFNKKCRDYAALTGKKLLNCFKQIQQQLNLQQKKLIDMEKSSLIYRLRMCLESRVSPIQIAQKINKNQKHRNNSRQCL